MLEPAKKHSIHQQQSFVVRQTAASRRLRLLGIVLVVVLLPSLSGLLTYYYFGSEERELSETIRLQQAELKGLSEQLDYAEQMRANADIASEVDQLAMEELRKELVFWGEQYGQLEEKIKFYQSLMDPNPTNSGIFVESVEIEPTKEDGRFNYRIVVAQRSSNHNRVNGSVDINLISEKNSDGIQSISLKELTGEQDQLTLGFKFFQQFDGSLNVPPGFSPEKLRVVVKIKGNSSAQLEEIIDWAVRS